MTRKALVTIGVIFVVVSSLGGVLSGDAMLLLGGIAVGVFFFALAEIIHNQLNILYQLQRHNEHTQQLHMESVICPECDQEYDEVLVSCPHCGHIQKK